MLVRATLDLPLGAGAQIPMARRRAATLAETLRWLAGRGARVTVCGDAGGADLAEEEARFDAVRRVVQGLAPDVRVVDSSSGGGVSAEDGSIVDGLIASHDLFVNDSFQWSYLPLPSLMLPPGRLPSVAGRGVQRNLEALAPFLSEPERPFVAVLGGNRPFLRLHRLEGLILRADTVLVGGAMALPILQAIAKQPAGATPPELLAEFRRVHGLAERVMHRLELPEDLVVDGEVGGHGAGGIRVAPSDKPVTGSVMDIGPITALRFAEMVEGAGSVLWAGALGRVEDERFAAGTTEVAAALWRTRAPAVVGGDSLATTLAKEGLLDERVATITATDAALELLKNGRLPALAALATMR